MMKLDCEAAREAWLWREADGAEAPAIPVDEHFAECPECERFVTAVAKDQELIRNHFAKIAVPAVPSLEFRDALAAASGFPRRVSLAIIPFLLALLLALALAILGGYFLVQQGFPK
ncbi:MAG: hypothetical protein L0Z55_04045 [Planctomycetes bacterium]|nr:hypothetical protein [Planctomycetota bacterium]